MQLFSATDPSELAGIAGTYTIPWKNRQSTELLAAYVDTSADISIAGLSSEVGGSNLTLGAKHVFELPPLVAGGEVIKTDAVSASVNGERPFLTGRRKTRQSFGVFHEAGVGLNLKVTDNDLSFGGATTISDSVTLFQLMGEYTLRQTDKSGESNLSVELFVSPGAGSGDFDALRTGADETYAYSRLLLEREHDIFGGMMLKGRIGGQISTSNLLASEQFGIGGFSSVRGYPERVSRGDNAFFFSLELHSPSVRPLASLFDTGFDDNLTLLAFLDYARASSVDELTISDESQTLVSVGIGVRYDLGENLKFRCDYGIPLRDLDTPPFEESVNDGQFHVGLLWTF